MLEARLLTRIRGPRQPSDLSCAWQGHYVLIFELKWLL
jgi:hypothetical protein